MSASRSEDKIFDSLRQPVGSKWSTETWGRVFFSRGEVIVASGYIDRGPPFVGINARHPPDDRELHNQTTKC